MTRASIPRKGGYFVVCEWMIRQFGLTGRKLIVYALIHSFSQDGVSVFQGSLNYICFYSGYSKQHLIKILREMEKQNLIERMEIPFENNPARHYVNYWTTYSRINPGKRKKVLEQNLKD